MWLESRTTNAIRAIADVPSTPLWIVVHASRHDDQVAAEIIGQEGLLYVFDNLVVFRYVSHDELGKAEGIGVIPNSWQPHDFIHRWSFSEIANVSADVATKTLCITEFDGTTFKLFVPEEIEAVQRAMTHLHRRPPAPQDDEETFDVDPQRGAIMYPQVTEQLQKSIGKNPYECSCCGSEFVVFQAEGITFTSCRIQFLNRAAWWPDVMMVRRTEHELIVLFAAEGSMPMRVRCHPFLQTIAIRLWLAALSAASGWDIDGVSGARSKMGFAQSDVVAQVKHIIMLERLHRQFCSIDSSGNGTIEADELEDACGSLFSCESFLPSFFRALDADNDRVITYVEFASGMMDMLSADVLAKTRFSFRVFDIDCDGTITKNEMLLILQSFVSTGDVAVDNEELEDTADALFTLIDLDHSGEISLEEYAEALDSNPQVRELLRRVGLSTERRSKVHIADEMPMCFGDKHWDLSTAITQALLLGLNQSKSVDQEINISLAQKDFEHVMSTGSSIAAQVVFAHGAEIGSANIRRGVETTRKSSEVITYAPKAFDDLRVKFGVTSIDIQDSFGLRNMAGNLLIGAAEIMRLPKWNAPFPYAFVSGDGMFFVHGISTDELKQLISMLPQYVDYVTAHPDTLLPRFLSVQSIRNGDHVLNFVVILNPMRNVRPINAVLRLKGVENRSEPGQQLCEADLPAPIELSSTWRHSFLQQLGKDAKFLCECKCSNFSLIAGLERLPKRKMGKASQSRDAPANQSGGSCVCCRATAVREQPATSPGGLVRAESLKSMSPGVKVRADKLRVGVGHLPPISLFHGSEGGVVSADLGPVIMFFTEVLTRLAETELPNCDAFVQYFDKWISGEDEAPLQSMPPSFSQCTFTPIVRENGKPGFVAIDSATKAFVLANANGQPILNFKLDDECSFSSGKVDPTTVYCHGRELTVRPLAISGKKAPILFSFENIVQREAFVAMAYRTLRDLPSPPTTAICGYQSSTINVFVATFNVGDAPPSGLAHLFAKADAADLVCITAEECSYSVKGKPDPNCEANWFAQIASGLPQHIVLAAVSLWSIRLILLVRAKLVNFVSSVVYSSEATGVGRVMGNKGGVAVGLKLCNSSFAFIGSHLAAHLEKVADRNADFLEIIDGVSKELAGPSVCFLNAYHHVFWCGDLNYRINHEFHDVVEKSYKNELTSMYDEDQLLAEMKMGRVFAQFVEPMPTFTPTYRFLRDTDATKSRVYDDWKHRIPSWCDRVLHKSLGNPLDTATRTMYDACHEVRSSDHSPVFALFDVCIRNQYLPRGDPLLVSYIVVSNLRCSKLMQADKFGLSDPYIKFCCPFAVDAPRDNRTPILYKTLDPQWEGSFKLQLHKVELGYVCAEYFTFVIRDSDAGGASDPLGEAVCSMHIFSDDPVEPHNVELPVMFFGLQKGTLQATLKLIMEPAAAA